MRIVVCEDEQYWIDEIQKSVSKWAAAKRIDNHCSAFMTPRQLMDHLAEHMDTDVILLDISFGEKDIDGMALAKHIRETGNPVPIVFITSAANKAIDGYLVDAVGFLSKPIDDRRLSLFLDKVFERKRGQRAIRLMADGRMVNVYQKDIIYVEIDDHKVTYHTVQGNLTIRGTLGEVLMTLDEEYFMQIHRSYVIALDRIDSIKTSYPYSVDLRNNIEVKNLPVSRKYISKLIEVYSDGVLEKMI